MAPEPIGPGGFIPSALRGISEGLSANQWAAVLRESGAGLRRSVALSIYSQARSIAAEYGNEPTRPLNAVPTYQEAKSWPTREASGVLQTVQLFYRERVTGNIIQRFYNVKTPNGITRQDAINSAVNANVGNAAKYQQELIGAVHTGTANLVAQDVA